MHDETGTGIVGVAVEADEGVTGEEGVSDIAVGTAVVGYFDLLAVAVVEAQPVGAGVEVVVEVHNDGAALIDVEVQPRVAVVGIVVGATWVEDGVVHTGDDGVDGHRIGGQEAHGNGIVFGQHLVFAVISVLDDG